MHFSFDSLRPSKSSFSYVGTDHNKLEMLNCVYRWVKSYKLQIKNVLFVSLNIAFFLANSADPDEMPQHAAFHLGHHCLLKNPV